jgi:Bacterial cadherin-like domain
VRHFGRRGDPAVFDLVGGDFGGEESLATQASRRASGDQRARDRGEFVFVNLAGGQPADLGGATATQQPVEMKFACAVKSNGLMRYVSNLNQCKKTEDKATSKPGPVLICVQPDGSVRKVPNFNQPFVRTPRSARPLSSPVFVSPNNQPPVAVNDAYSTDEDTPLTVSAPGVLANDTDADGDPLTAVLVSGPSHAASFSLNANG